MTKKKKATPEEIIKIIEDVLIPAEMKCIAEDEKEMKELKAKGMTDSMFYGYHFGRKSGHLATIETLEKTVRALKGTY